MKKIPVLSALAVVMFVSCRHEAEDVSRQIRNGELSKAVEIIELKLRNTAERSTADVQRWKKTLADIQAVKREYTSSYDAVYGELKAKIPDLSGVDMNRWEGDGSLEYYRIDGQKKYYANCTGDLFRVNQEAARRANIPRAKESDISRFPLETITSFEGGRPLSKRIQVAFSFFEDIGSLPDRSLLKAWIPYVRENKFQSNIRIAHSSMDHRKLPKSDDLTSLIYFEKVLDKKANSNADWQIYFKKPAPSWIKPMKNPASLGDSTLICQFIYEYESYGSYQKIDPRSIHPYRTSDPEYRQYTRETEGHLFTPDLKTLSKEIIGRETSDYLKAREIYEWICKNIVWTDPKPVLGDAAEYAAKYRRGDCGAKSNLFISLCRINKIPARPQGGWRVQPDGDHAQHSWAQVYFEPYGWMPVDATAGAHLIDHRDERVKYFYFGNCTPYHLIIYDDEEAFFPAKSFEPIHGGGAQLGAFEWKGGDIEPNIRIDSRVDSLASRQSQF